MMSPRSRGNVRLPIVPVLVALLLALGAPAAVGAQEPPVAATPVAGERIGVNAITAEISATPVPLVDLMPAPPPVFVGPPVQSVPPPPPVGMPLRVVIPTIGLMASVERVGLLPDKSVGTPQNYANTAWYDGGARPGETGNAVINGHVDSVGGPAVFYRLPQLKPGDYVYVVDDVGVERTFIVRGIERYGLDNAPLERIFGSRNDGTFLNLITCDNQTAFNRRTAEYSGYVTVYTELLPTP